MSVKINKNVGLTFKGDGRVPSIAFKGNGVYADYFEQEFKKNKSSSKIVKDEVLLEKLFKLPAEAEISTDLYELVAILLVHVYSLEKKLKGNLRDNNLD